MPMRERVRRRERGSKRGWEGEEQRAIKKEREKKRGRNRIRE